MDDMKNENIREVDMERKMKNILSLAVLLGGLFVGSLFVDVVQLVRGEGFSQRILNKSDVFSLGGKTWVAYKDPLIRIQVLTDDSCESCNPEEVIVGLKKELPTIVTEKVDVTSDEGKKLASDLDIKTIPAFVFSKDIENAELFSQAEAVFENKGNSYLLNSVAVGLPVGKYIAAPSVTDKSIVVGPKDAKVKIVQFSDFQCPYCKELHETVMSKILKEYDGKVQFVFKNLPLTFHAQAQNAALAAECANEQGKFTEYGDKLFATQDAWGKLKDANPVFKRYAAQLKLNTTDFNGCLDSKKHADDISADTKEAESLGITGTPATFINDQFKNGLVTYEDLKSIIDSELAK